MYQILFFQYFYDHFWVHDKTYWSTFYHFSITMTPCISLQMIFCFSMAIIIWVNWYKCPTFLFSVEWNSNCMFLRQCAQPAVFLCKIRHSLSRAKNPTLLFERSLFRAFLVPVLSLGIVIVVGMGIGWFLIEIEISGLWCVIEGIPH